MGAKNFYEWFLGWYKEVCNEVTVMISVPNEIQPYIMDDVIILDLFKSTSDSVDLSLYLKTLIQKVDEHGISVYLDPSPRSNDSKTKEFYISLFENHGFELTPNKEFMSRVYKKNNL